MSDEFTQSQIEVCKRYNAVPLAAPLNLKVGISQTVREGHIPLNAIRYFPVGDTTGWYIWAGEDYSEDPDFFRPLHVQHLVDWCPSIVSYLQLPPGWGVVLAQGYEDVWFDEKFAAP